jgi:hypothetical protein
MSNWELLEKILRPRRRRCSPGMMLQMGLLGFAYVYSDVSYRARILRVFGMKPERSET